ncbi:hypothetical protein AK812_SmicGene21790 [Symbiodinium microadriaticum]|uniref:Uncharacterized protein n=1 Tax=Symbiodinium microadriaticum TaxID=2951 RepID=A0A1Q9DLD5_SYMMI|nr:hypothetical protein AK812_SmicGene21790 [Symbiodinium microadriaticum]
MAPSLTDKFAAAHTTKQMRLVVLGIEVGGRFSTEAASFLRLLARHRAAGIAAPLRAGAEACVAGEAPELHEILADMRGSLSPDDQPAARSQMAIVSQALEYAAKHKHLCAYQELAVAGPAVQRLLCIVAAQRALDSSLLELPLVGPVIPCATRPKKLKPSQATASGSGNQAQQSVASTIDCSWLVRTANGTEGNCLKVAHHQPCLVHRRVRR